MNILDEQKQELTDVLFTKYFIRGARKENQPLDEFSLIQN